MRKQQKNNERKKAPRWLSYIGYISTLGAALLSSACNSSSTSSTAPQEKEEKPYRKILDEDGLEWMVNVKDNNIAYSVKHTQNAEIHVKDSEGIRKLTEYEPDEKIMDVRPRISNDYVYFVRETSPDGFEVKRRGYRIPIKGGKEEAVTPENEDWWLYYLTSKGTPVGIKDEKVYVDGKETGAKARAHLDISPDESRILTHYVKGANPSEVYLQEKDEKGWKAPIKIAEGYENPQFINNGKEIFAKKGNSFYVLDLKGKVLKEYNVGNSILTPYIEDGMVYFTLIPPNQTTRGELDSGKLEDMLK